MDQFEKLYHDYHKDISLFLLRLTGYQHSLAEELTQETFYQAIRSFHRFKGQCGVKSWLCQIAKNMFFNTLRSNKKIVKVPLEKIVLQLGSPNSVSDDYERKELIEKALAIIMSFDERNRDVMVYRIYSEMPYSQIAQVLSISESSAKVIYMRGKQKLIKILREECGYEI